MERATHQRNGAPRIAPLRPRAPILCTHCDGFRTPTFSRRSTTLWHKWRAFRIERSDNCRPPTVLGCCSSSFSARSFRWRSGLPEPRDPPDFLANCAWPEARFQFAVWLVWRGDIFPTSLAVGRKSGLPRFSGPRVAPPPGPRSGQRCEPSSCYGARSRLSRATSGRRHTHGGSGCSSPTPEAPARLFGDS